MAILRAEMARCISINIFGIDICFMLNKCLYNTEITSQTRDMKRCSKIICPRVNLSLKFDKNLNHRCMSLTSCQMKRREAIRVSAVDYLKHLILLIELLLGIRQDLVDLIGVALVNFGPVVHLYFLNVLFSLLLLG